MDIMAEYAVQEYNLIAIDHLTLTSYNSIDKSSQIDIQFTHLQKSIKVVGPVGLSPIASTGSPGSCMWIEKDVQFHNVQRHSSQPYNDDDGSFKRYPSIC